ncbi:MAG TPA: dihydroorotate dehydrogenase electron transfer subunit [Thermoplasmata archaeon]|nr:dihydroorotate dehydrogenase electron transfer subunit [Thermoplasmata archaeon]
MMRQACAVTESTRETPSTVTLRFEYPLPANPGQFVMVWVPGDDELPMSLSYTGPSKGVTVKRMGATSGRILGIEPGTVLGIRGPYGNTFDLRPKRILVVGGGSGTAVLAPAAEAAATRGSRVTCALGATTAAELLFVERLRPISNEVHVATDDGSSGFHGYVTEVAGRLLATEPFDAVWTCGPEVMMRKVIEAAHRPKVPVFCSVERHMKCAVGLCDACALGPLHPCIDGPVFPAPELTGLPEFGRAHRDPSGRRVPL